jgi:hypothetical protein
VVTGKDATTGERQVAEPDHLTVWRHVGKLGSWETATYTLHDELWDPTWIEHPLGREVDVIALPINPPETAIIYPLDLSIAEKDLAIWPSSAVSIIGFPHQIVAGGKFPIWKTGHIASDVGLDFDNKPAFLIDATTKPGMSGSPVFARQSPVYLTNDGTTHCGTRTKFLGIYSSHFHNVDVGQVWKPKALLEIISRAL